MNPVNPFEQALHNYRTMVLAVFGFSMAIGVLMFVSPLYMMQIYDRVLSSGDVPTLVALSLIAFALMGAHGVLDHVRARIVARHGVRFDADIAIPLMCRVQRAVIVNPQANAAFALQDAARLREFLTGTGVIAVCEMPFALVFLVVSFLIHPMLGLVALAGATFLAGLAVVTERVTKQPASLAQAQTSEAQAFSTSIVGYARDVRALGMEEAVTRQWREKHWAALRRQSALGDRSGPITTLSRQVRLALQTAILGVGAYLAIEKAITPGMMLASSIMAGRALAPIDQVIGQWKQFGAAHQAYLRLRNIFAVVGEEPDKTRPFEPTGSIEVANLAVAAPGGRSYLVQGIRFSIARGDVLGIIGANGCGKTSILRTLLGVQEAAGGNISFDDIPLTQFDRRSIGMRLGYLPQRVRLFTGTIGENVARFSGAGAEAVLDALRLAGAEPMVRALPEGVDTKVVPEAAALSDGLVQRIGLARTVFGNPPIVFLDEPQTFLDAAGRDALVTMIRALKAAGRTVVLVTQDLRLQAICDRSMVVAAGRMQAFGPTADILRALPAHDAGRSPVLHSVQPGAVAAT